MLRLVRILLARFFALVPRRHRYRVARYVAILGAPIAWLFAPREWRDLNNGVAIALWAVFRAMNRDEIEFEFPIDVDGASIIEQERGLLLVTGHFRMTNTLGVWLRDRGRRFHFTRADAAERVFLPGTRVPLPYLLRSANVLVEMRSAIAAGEIVFVAADSSDPIAHGFTIGNLHVSDAAPRSAEKWGVPIAYLETRVDRRGYIHAKITRGTASDLRSMFEKWLSLSRRGSD